MNPRYFPPRSWQEKAFKALRQLVIQQHYLTSDDLHEIVEGEPNHVNEWGAIFDLGARMGLLIDTGTMIHSRRAESHHRKITLWASCMHVHPTVKDHDPVTAYKEQRGEPLQETLL